MMRPFLKEAEKLPGIQSVTPVVPLAVHLSMEEYSMDTEHFWRGTYGIFSIRRSRPLILHFGADTGTSYRKRSALCVFGQQWSSDLGKTAEPAS